MMAFRLLRPAWLIDINEIAALKFVAPEADAVRMGACTRQCDIQRDDALAASVPLLRQALALVGHVQTRNRGTAGGSLVHADPSAELPLVAQILEARMALRSKSGTRTLPAADFFEDAMTTSVAHRRMPDGNPVAGLARAQDRIGLHRDQPPPWRLRHRRRRRPGRGGRRGHCTRATFGVGGAAPTPAAFPALARRLVGTRLDKAVLRDVAHEAAAALEPGSRHPCQRRLPAPSGRRADDARAAIRLRRREDGPMSETLYPIAIDVNGVEAHRPGHGAHVAGRLAARASASHRHAYRLRAWHLRRLLGDARRRAGPLLPDVCRAGGRPSHHHGRGPRAAGRTV